MTNKDRRISIRLNQQDLDEMALIRETEGLTGFADVLHLLLEERRKCPISTNIITGEVF